MKKRLSHKPIVFVHLGLNPTPTLVHFSKLAQEQLNGSRLFLISDHPNQFVGFAGTVIHYQSKHPAIQKLGRKFPHYKNIAGGYWIHTIERLFALGLMKEVLEDDESFLHLESDVMSLVTEDIYDLLNTHCRRVAYPRFSSQAGIASILFSPSIECYEKFLSVLADIIITSETWMTDMDLLGKALETEESEELPSDFPSRTPFNDRDGNQVIFDGAALGQYLFGRDPLHTSGTPISGYINPNSGIDFMTSYWAMDYCRSRPGIFISHRDIKNIRVANLHVHSKQLIPKIDLKDENWIQIVKAANRTIPPLVGEYVEDLIHTKPLAVRDKISRAIQQGIYPFLLAKMKSIMSSKNE